MTRRSVGTVRWFGASWDAPVCEGRTHVDTPIGATCPDCEQAIRDEDQGIGVPYIQDLNEPGVYQWWHLDCWMRMIGWRSPNSTSE